KLRARALPVVESGAVTISASKAKSVETDLCVVDVTYKGAGGKDLTVTYALQGNNPIVKTTPGAGVAGLRLEAATRIGVIPDFFTDDMVIDARAIPIDKTEVPAENFFMNMLDNGNSIVTAIWDKNEKDVELTLSGEKEARVIAGVNVFYGAGGGIWLAALEKKGIWAQTEMTSNSIKQATTLDWKCPFRGKWKGDFMRVDHTIDSWEFESPGTRWSGVAGNYTYPCWFDPKDPTKAAIQPATKFPNGNFAGPFVAYAIERNKDTPLDQLTITDLMRNSLGVGPCQHIMDVAGQGVTSKGIFTCGVNEMVVDVFLWKRQKDELVFMDRMMKEVQVFIKAIGDRINMYAEFRGQTLQYLGEQKKAHPELADFIGRLEAQTTKIHGTKVDSVPGVAKIGEQIMKEAMSDNPRRDINSLTEEGKGGSIASTGGWQDDIVARSRNSVKILRQMATIEMAVNPKSAELCKEIRKRTQQALRGALGHEMR
ncbi:MAG: hypothetical protein C0404_14475, partial [Verrucomicrobia bacterium]|nr:hypothetical protein [Verrucomicrobiota bacterium]